MKADEATVAAILLVLAGFALGVVASEKAVAWVKEVLPTLATLLAAYLGAFFAYKGETRRRSREEWSRNLAAGNRAILALKMQLETVLDYQEKHIDPYRGDPARVLNMPVMRTHDVSKLRVDVDSLGFLVERGAAKILAGLAQQQEIFSVAVTTIIARANLFESEVFPRLEQAGATQERTYGRADVENMIGERMLVSAQRVTDDLIKAVDMAVGATYEISQDLSGELGKIFSQQNVLTLTFPPARRFE